MLEHKVKNLIPEKHLEKRVSDGKVKFLVCSSGAA
jgi:hypothetical protein